MVFRRSKVLLQLGQLGTMPCEEISNARIVIFYMIKLDTFKGHIMHTSISGQVHMTGAMIKVIS